MRMKLDILLDPNPVYTGDKVHFQFFQIVGHLGKWPMD